MIAFKTFTGIAAPLDRSNVDTDAIIPKEYLKSIKRTGFGPNLFDAWRYLDSNIEHDDDSRKINPDFILNKAPYNKAEILLARENFGCGSSREHAVWALSNFGFKVVLAPSFGDIFYSNSFKNGFLPIRLQIEEINILFNCVKSTPIFMLTINLEEQFIETQDNKRFIFNIDSNLKTHLLEGLDHIDLTLKYSDVILKYEKNRAKLVPWLFKEI
jgi:3-isopropylmalate/(R)-2-methylmalate dehydratase small subunit